ncbi:MAG: hypothetical protein NW201_14125 [Gemmatimonadales bacterium]|nr:hypothetical protein [Gemmatimonadales bacterium]
MAHINDCIPGRSAKLLASGVARVTGKSGTIVEVVRTKRGSDALEDRVTVDVPGHGEIVVGPADLEIQG